MSPYTLYFVLVYFDTFMILYFHLSKKINDHYLEYQLVLLCLTDKRRVNIPADI